MKAQRTQIQERFTYFTTDSIEMVNDILKNGFSCSPNDLNILGKLNKIKICFFIYKEFLK
jgi:hypothetical protein